MLSQYNKSDKEITALHYLGPYSTVFDYLSQLIQSHWQEEGGKSAFVSAAVQRTHVETFLLRLLLTVHKFGNSCFWNTHLSEGK